MRTRLEVMCVGVLAMSSLLVACDNRGAAQRRLTREGFTEVQLTPAGNGFEFTASRGGAHCTGAIQIERGLFGSNESISQQCMTLPETSPTPAAPPATAAEPSAPAPNAAPANGPAEAHGAAAAAPRVIDGHAVDDGCWDTLAADPSVALALPEGADMSTGGDPSENGILTHDASAASRAALERFVTRVAAPANHRLVITESAGTPRRWWVRCIVTSP